MSNNSNAGSTNRKRMDDKTAIAFAADRFEQLHPKGSYPEWLLRCTVISVGIDRDRNYRVSLSVTPIATNNAVRYFEVLVNASTGETTVLLDEDASRFIGSDLQGFASTSR